MIALGSAPIFQAIEELTLASKEPPVRQVFRTPTVWILAAVLILLVSISLFGRSQSGTELNSTQFQQAIADGRVQSATIDENSHFVTGQLTDGSSYRVGFAEASADEL